MKIAIDINELTRQGTTGVQVYTREIVQALIQIDRDNDYILYANCRDADLSRLLYTNRKDGDLSRLSPFPFWTYTKFPQEIAKDKPDILFMPIQAVPFLKKPKNIKLVVTVHDFAFLFFAEYFTTKDRVLLKFHTKRAVQMADQIIVPSMATKNDIIKFYQIDESKITVIHHGIKEYCHPEARRIPQTYTQNDKLHYSEETTIVPPDKGGWGVRNFDDGSIVLKGCGTSNADSVGSSLPTPVGSSLPTGAPCDFTKNHNSKTNPPYLLFVGVIQPRKNIIRLIEAFEIVKSKSIPSLSKEGLGVVENKKLPLSSLCKEGIGVVLNHSSNPILKQGGVGVVLNHSSNPILKQGGVGVVEKTNLKLFIVGKKGWQADQTYKRAKESPFSQDIVFLGGVSDEELHNLYQNAHIFILPSLYEGFGLPVLEAMSHGIPSIVSNNSSLAEITGESALLVNPSDANDIEEKISLFLNSKNLRQQYSEKGTKQAQNFTWQKSAQQTLEVFGA